jgi:hypothetical protein
MTISAKQSRFSATIRDVICTRFHDVPNDNFCLLHNLVLDGIYKRVNKRALTQTRVRNYVNAN